MPWNDVSVMAQRREFVRLALQEGVNRRELCRLLQTLTFHLLSLFVVI